MCSAFTYLTFPSSLCHQFRSGDYTADPCLGREWEVGWGLVLQDTADMGRTREDVHDDVTMASVFFFCPFSPPGAGEALPGMTEIVFRALSTLKVLSACRFPTLINSVNSL